MLAQRAAAAGRSPDAELPHPEPATVPGAVGLAPVVAAAKPKLVLKLAGLLAAMYVGPTDYDPDGVGALSAYVPSGFASPVPGCRVASGMIPADLYLVSNRPGGQPIGISAPTRISALAFGAIPITATVIARQVVHNGELVPIRATNYLFDSSLSPACDPGWYARVTSDPSFSYTIGTGQLNLSISQVKVDRQRIDVGSDCHTANPVNLNLWGSPDYLYYSGGTLRQQYDRSKSVRDGYDNHPGSTDLTIPNFVNCRAATGDDVSALISAMVSGSGNRLAVQQGMAQLSGFDLNNPGECRGDPPTCPTPPPYPSIAAPK
jgi:hypothetical protein